MGQILEGGIVMKLAVQSLEYQTKRQKENHLEIHRLLKSTFLTVICLKPFTSKANLIPTPPYIKATGKPLYDCTTEHLLLLTVLLNSCSMCPE